MYAYEISPRPQLYDCTPRDKSSSIAVALTELEINKTFHKIQRNLFMTRDKPSQDTNLNKWPLQYLSEFDVNILINLEY
jgi:hypothetical protein